MNKISQTGLACFSDKYAVSDDVAGANGILVRSQDMHEMEFGRELLSIARAGAGVNNIPLDRCAEEGIVVFNTPGANANAVKELVLAGMLLAARNIPAGIAWANTLTENIGKAVEKGKSQVCRHRTARQNTGRCRTWSHRRSRSQCRLRFRYESHRL